MTTIEFKQEALNLENEIAQALLDNGITKVEVHVSKRDNSYSPKFAVWLVSKLDDIDRSILESMIQVATLFDMRNESDSFEMMIRAAKKIEVTNETLVKSLELN